MLSLDCQMPKFLKAAAAAAVLLASAAGTAHAADAPRIYFVNVMPAAVTVEIDDKDAGGLPAQTASSIPLAPGEHVIKVITEDGSSVSKPWQMDAKDLASAKGGRFWCVAVAPRGEGDTYGYLLQLPADKCKAFIEAGV